MIGTSIGANEPSEENIQIVRAASRVAGRVLFSGMPTGVAVTATQHHGGRFPSSTQSFTTSVGVCSDGSIAKADHDAGRTCLDRLEKWEACLSR